MSRVAVRRSGAESQARRERALVVILVVAVCVALGTTADLIAAPSDGPPAEPVAQPPATAGTWYCPAVADEGETATLTVAAAGDEPSQIVVDRYGKGRAAPDRPATLEPGQSSVVTLEGADAMAPVAVRWSGGAAVATWRVDGRARTAAAPCEPAPAERWYIPGFNTMLGSKSTLHLFNPYTANAVVRVTFAEPEGSTAPVLTDNILVPAGRTTSLDLRRYKPEEPDLGAVVDVLAGRVVAQGELSVTPPRGTTGAAGRLLLPAASEPSQTWAFATAVQGRGSESWLNVINPGDDDAAVEVRVSSPSGDQSGMLAEVSVPPGGIARIELAGASSTPEFGVTVNVVNDEAVVVSRLMATTVNGTQVLAGGLGAPATATDWVLLGAGTAGRQGSVAVYNPNPEATTVDVIADQAPPAWSRIAVPPNARVALDIAEAGADQPSIPVRVRADAPVVAGLRSTSSGDNARLWMMLGVADVEWLGRPTRPPVRYDPLLSTRRAAPAPEPTDRLDQQLEEELAPAQAATPPAAPAPTEAGS